MISFDFILKYGVRKSGYEICGWWKDGWTDRQIMSSKIFQTVTLFLPRGMRPPWRCPTNSCPRLWSQAFLQHEKNAIRGLQTPNQSMFQFNWNLYLDQFAQSISITYVMGVSFTQPNSHPPRLFAFLSLSLSLAPSLLLTVFQCETYKVSIWTTDPLQVASFWQLMVPFHWRWKAAEVIMLSQRPNLWVRYFREGIRKAFPSPSSRCLVQVMNDIAIGEKKNMNLPGVKVDLPVLQDLHLNLLGEFVLDGGLMWMYIWYRLLYYTSIVRALDQVQIAVAVFHIAFNISRAKVLITSWIWLLASFWSSQEKDKKDLLEFGIPQAIFDSDPVRFVR